MCQSEIAIDAIKITQNPTSEPKDFDLTKLAEPLNKFSTPEIHGLTHEQKKRALIKIYLLRLLDGLENKSR